MVILWFCNMAPPEASRRLNEHESPFGGWYVNASRLLSQKESVRLTIAFPKQGINELVQVQGEKITYIAFPAIMTKKDYPFCKELIGKILDSVKPDITQVFGTEYLHSLAVMELCNPDRTVIHIQGLVSVYEQHYFAELPHRVIHRYTLRDILKNDNIVKQRKKMRVMGEYEIKALTLAKHVIGRTSWDYACVKRINPDIEYHFGNEILREEFYLHRWNIGKMKRHSIFASQGSYPIKGLHMLLQAMPDILARYPEAILYVGGQNITKTQTLQEKIKLSSYGKYLKELIRQNRLEDKVVFLGLLDDQQMCRQYLQSHVFVIPSAIENSPNSLGEAMLMGVPCVASDVGGISDLLKHGEEGFVYPFDAPYMLAHYICELFGSDELALRFSSSARAHAAITHSKEANIDGLLDVYKRIVAAKQ